MTPQSVPESGDAVGEHAWGPRCASLKQPSEVAVRSYPVWDLVLFRLQPRGFAERVDAGELRHLLPDAETQWSLTLRPVGAERRPVAGVLEGALLQELHFLREFPTYALDFVLLDESRSSEAAKRVSELLNDAAEQVDLHQREASIGVEGALIRYARQAVDSALLS